MNQPTNQPTEGQSDLQSFLTRLADVARGGGDVVQAITRGDVVPPENVPQITHGATGETLWARAEGKAQP